MTRKEYIVAVTEQLAAAPRTVLAGHGINAAVLKLVSERPDLMGKLSAFGYTLNTFKKGAKGLKKADNFRICGYKSFSEFNAKARIDIENFVAGLNEDDAASFQNNTNIVTFLALPDTRTDDLESDIANLKSVPVKFDNAVRKEFKVQGGFYVTIMFGNSAIRQAEAARAEAKAAVNEKLVEKAVGTFTKVKASFLKKQKAKLFKINKAVRPLAAKAEIRNAGMQQFADIAKTFGVESGKPIDVVNAMKRYTSETKKFLKSLNPAEQVVYGEALKYAKSGNMKMVEKLLAPLGNEKLTQIVLGGNLTTADAVIAARNKVYKDKIKVLTAKNEALLAKMQDPATTPRAKAQANFDIKKNANIIKALRAKMNITKDLSTATIRNKSEMLVKVNALIAEKVAKGSTVQAALSAAVATLPVSDEVKQQVKQQVIQQIAAGTPTQYAVQSAVQQIPVAAIQQTPVQQSPAQQVAATQQAAQAAAQQAAAPQTPAQQAAAQQVIAAAQQIPTEEIDDPEFEQGLIDVFGEEGAVDNYNLQLAGSASIKNLIDIL